MTDVVLYLVASMALALLTLTWVGVRALLVLSAYLRLCTEEKREELREIEAMRRDSVSHMHPRSRRDGIPL